MKLRWKDDSEGGRVQFYTTKIPGPVGTKVSIVKYEDYDDVDKIVTMEDLEFNPVTQERWKSIAEAKRWVESICEGFPVCPVCRGTKQHQCVPACPSAVVSTEGRGWYCDTDKRGREGCPVCPVCS